MMNCNASRRVGVVKNWSEAIDQPDTVLRLHLCISRLRSLISSGVRDTRLRSRSSSILITDAVYADLELAASLASVWVFCLCTPPNQVVDYLGMGMSLSVRSWDENRYLLEDLQLIVTGPYCLSPNISKTWESP